MISSMKEFGMGNKPDFGICDECGEYTDNIAYVGGDWVCTSCTRYG